jgi:hypothetical protein
LCPKSAKHDKVSILKFTQFIQHINWFSDIGDPFTLIKVYKEWLEMRRRNEDTKKWTRRCGIEESRLYEIIKLRRQFKQILEQSELLSTKTNNEWEALSSKERKVKIGEKRKLFKLKEKARQETRKRRMLKEGRHFDSILDEESGITFSFFGKSLKYFKI